MYNGKKGLNIARPTWTPSISAYDITEESSLFVVVVSGLDFLGLIFFLVLAEASQRCLGCFLSSSRKRSLPATNVRRPLADHGLDSSTDLAFW